MPPTPSVIADQILELQRGWSTRRDEHAIASLFEQTSGSELTEVKNLIEQHGDGQDLLKLLWEDIDAPPGIGNMNRPCPKTTTPAVPASTPASAP